MKAHDTTSTGATSTFLTGAILFANLNPTGLADYAVKATIGGLIWLGFKLAGDYLSIKLKDKWLHGKK